MAALCFYIVWMASSEMLPAALKYSDVPGANGKIERFLPWKALFLSLPKIFSLECTIVLKADWNVVVCFSFTEAFPVG